MARVGIVFGMLLCGLTYAAMVWDPVKIPAQFIPMMFGVPLLFCGVVALNPHRRKASMHAAAGVTGLGGVAGSLWCISRILKLATGEATDIHGLTVISSMSFLCVIFVLLCLWPFVKMRRKQSGSENVDSEVDAGLHQASSNVPAIKDAPVIQDVSVHDKA